MDNGIEGIGAAITGGLAARALEPGHGEGQNGHGETECANCSVPLIGPHCHFCGQKAHVHRSIAAIGHDLVHGVLHLDGKFWRTLPLLIWRPGELTWRYTHGERAKFVSPLAMFLFAVFTMFAVLAIYGVSLTSLQFGEEEAGQFGVDYATQAIDAELATAREERNELSGEPGEDNSSQRLTQLDARIAELESDRQTVVNIDTAQSEFTVIGDGMPETGWARLDHGIEKINDNPGLALYKLQANGYKFSWLLIPLSVPFVWVLFFWTRRFHLYDHTVFVTYSLAFMSLLAVALTVAGFAGLGNPWITMGAIFVPPIHIYRQLKGAYRLHWASALIRTVLLTSFCFVTAALFFILLLGIGALG